MPAREVSSATTLGFLTVIDDLDQGWFGGYLALNAAGRPLEFHCTAPVKANRAQEILFGATLASYVQGELIGATLVGRAKTAPRVVCTDRPAVLSLGATVDVPVVLVLPSDDGGEQLPSGLGETPFPLRQFRLGANRLAMATNEETAHRLVEETCGPTLGELDLLEPFSRIREALQEARSAHATTRPTRQNAAA